MNNLYRLSENKIIRNNTLKQSIGILITLSIPLICILVVCIMYRKPISDFYLPSSYWNDELFYFKQVESMVKFGSSLGFFGYNESYSVRGGFGAWSPLLLYPWYFWGKLFGWNLISPLIANCVFLTTALCLFALLTKPDVIQGIKIFVISILFFPLTRWMLSCTPEIICISIMIILFGLIISNDKQSYIKFFLTLILISFLGLLRPYFIILFLFSIILNRNNIYRWIANIVMILATISIYVFISKNYTADYFGKIINTYMLDQILENGIIAGLINDGKYLLLTMKQFLVLLIDGIKNSSFSGAVSLSFLLILFCIFHELYKNKSIITKYTFSYSKIFLLCSLFLLSAIFCFYTLQQGARHLMSFCYVGILILCILERRFMKSITVSLFFLFIFIITMTKDPYEYKVPFQEIAIASEMEFVRETLNKEEMLDSEKLGFQNTVIWVASDIVKGENVTFKWQLLYALPEGLGINLCKSDYVEKNINSIKSRYIATTPGGNIDQLCYMNEWEILVNTENIVIYDLQNKGEYYVKKAN